MGAPNDVTVTVSGPLPIKPIGVMMAFAVNTVPICEIAFDPLQSEILQDPDSYQRKGLVTVTINVKGDTIQFQGYMDGLSMSQNVGSISYAVILKGTAQWLLETDTLIPGLSPYGLNPLAAYQFKGQATTDPAEVMAAIELGDVTIKLAGTSLAETYKSFAIAALQYQSSSSFETLVNNQANPGLNVTTLKDILSSSDRRKKLQQVTTYLGGMDTSALNKLTDVYNPANAFNGKSLIQLYCHGSRVLWENLVEFYGLLGGVMIPTNNSIIVVPNNGFIDPGHTTPGMGQHSGVTNVAFPADYNFVSYQAQGYVDVGYVSLVSTTPSTAGAWATYPLYQGGYPTAGADSASPGASLLIVEANPLICQAADAYFASIYAPQQQQNQPNTAANKMTAIQSGGFGPAAKTSDVPSVKKVAQNTYNSVLNSFGNNYAEIKFLQARYGDRGGSITSRFNPNWCPGTVGYLYQREVYGGGGSTQGGSGVFVDYMVQRVCHRVALSAPNTGTAVTEITFNCGRVGTNNFTVENDALYQYGYGQVQQAQASFLAGVGATGN